MKTFGWFSEIYDQVKNTFEFKLKALELGITEKILSVMQQKKITRADLAIKLGTSKAAVSKLLNDGSNITLKRLLKISQALDCDVNVQIVPIAQDAITYEVVIPVFIKNDLSQYWLGGLGGDGRVSAQADNYHGPFLPEDQRDASAA